MVTIAEQASSFTEIDSTATTFSGMGDGVPREIAVGDVRDAAATGMHEADGTTVAIGSMVGVEGAIGNVNRSSAYNGTTRSWGSVAFEIAVFAHQLPVVCDSGIAVVFDDHMV